MTPDEKRAYHKAWRERNREHCREYQREYQRKLRGSTEYRRSPGEKMDPRRFHRAWVLIKENMGCDRCGYNAYGGALHFHHRDHSTKSAEVGVLITQRKPIDMILDEVDKCDLLCANCHAEKHAE